MIAQWENEWISLCVVWVQFPAMAKYFKGFFPGCSHSANPSWASLTENGSISPQWHHTTCWQRGGRPKFNYGQTNGGNMIFSKEAVFIKNISCDSDIDCWASNYDNPESTPDHSGLPWQKQGPSWVEHWYWPADGASSTLSCNWW